MSGEPNTPENSATDTTEGTKTETVEIDWESDAAKAALAAEVEKVVGPRVAREKGKITAAEERADAAEEKLSTAEQTIQTLTQEKEAAEQAKVEVDKTALRLKLAIEEKIAPEVIATLRGETEDELREAIKTITGSVTNVDRLFNGKDQTDSEIDSNKSMIENAGKSAHRYLPR